MKTVDLKQILESKFTDYSILIIDIKNGKFENNEPQLQLLIDAMREACEQTVDLCAENAGYEYGEGDEDIFIDKQSILKTKTQIV